MRFRPLVLLAISAIALISVNLMTLYIFSPGVTECVSRYKQYERNIYLLEDELQTLRHELKSAWEILGHALPTNNHIQSNSNQKQVPTTHTDNAIVMITPTYTRWTQKADLTRLYQTLLHVRELTWIVVEDSVNKTELVKRFLAKCKVNHVHLNVRTPQDLQLQKTEPKWRKNRGVEQRNKALQWIRDNLQISGKESVVYFGDDDNTYDLELFNEIKKTQTVRVWPVGICGGLKWEGPVCHDNRVVKWHTSWAKKRPFPIDFAGFAVNSKLVFKFKDAIVNPYSRIGWLESDFLSQMISPAEVVAGADHCTKVYVWHTRTEVPKTKDEEKLISQGQPSNPLIEV